MMERILLGVLCLSGWNISSCLSRQYHYVAEPMNWTEAQTYCRENYTDLATVENIEEMKQLNNTVLSSGINSNVWIGVYRNMLWKWSDNYTKSGAEYRNWEENQPFFYYADTLCVDLYNGEWYSHNCSRAESFVCYRGSQENPQFVHVLNRLNWSSAQRFCRKNYIELATVKNPSENHILTFFDTWAWIGLYSDPDIYWSDGSGSSFRYWVTYEYGVNSKSVACGAANLEDSGRWKVLHCETKLPFVCYSVPSSVKRQVIKRQVIKIKMKPEDSSLDLNDPAVKADILNKLQDRLKENGLSGVTLKWRVQPDGKVFHKEKKMSKKKKKREKTEL